jgi:hypothetical protein
MGFLGKIFGKQEEPTKYDSAGNAETSKQGGSSLGGYEWKKYCTKQGKEITIINTGELFGCETSLPTTDCCMVTDCIYHNTNFFGMLIAVQIANGVKPDFSSWTLESCELFITKNMQGKKNYCTSLPSNEIPAEDPAIYGNKLKALRDTIRSRNGSTHCLNCNADIKVDFKKLEQQIRQNQQIARQSSAVTIFSPDPNNPKVCLTCKGVICNACSKQAMATKRADKAEIKRLIYKYQPMIAMLPKLDQEQSLEACLSPDEPSTILCPKCRNDLLRDVDHITD